MSLAGRAGMAGPEMRLRAALDAAGVAITVTDASGVVVEANAATCALGHLDREDVVGADLADLARGLGAEDAEIGALGAALLGEPIPPYEAHRVLADGTRLHLSISVTPIRDAAGRPAGLTIVVADTAVQHHMRAERDRLDARARFLVDASRVLAGSLDLDRTLQNVVDLIVPRWADGSAIALIGDAGTMHVAADQNAEPGQSAIARTLLPDGTPPAPGGIVAEVVRSRRQRLIERFDVDRHPRVAARLRELGVVSTLFTPLCVREEVVGVLVISTTRSDRTLDQADAELFSELAGRAAQAIDSARLMRAMTIAEARFRTAFDSAPIGIALLTTVPDGQLRCAEVNPATCAITGHPRDKLLGQRVSDFLHPDDVRDDGHRLARLIDGTLTEVSTQKRFLRADGEVRWVLVRAARIDGGVLVAQLQDVTEQRRSQEQLEHLATHDPLTGLVNRRRFEEELEQTLLEVRRHGDGAAVMTLDIDNFKHVNDTYGHAIGDELLGACARALMDRTRLTDTVGRLGGDAFGVVLRRTSSQDARAVARELLDQIERVGVQVGPRQVRVTASAGLRALDDPGERTAGELLSEADMAMYDAKERGRNRLSLMEPGDLQPERVRARMRWSERIRDALEDDGFVLFEQPILRLEGDRVDRSELLIRMLDNDAQPIAPAAFLPIAERYGQMQAIDRWVVRNAIELLADRRAVAAEWCVEVNLSGASLTEAAVVDYIESEIRNAPIDPRNLVFEVTETAAISNLERARQLALRLSELGCAFALDDFGAGFASFAYLKHLPLDVIKIDGEFIRSLLTSRHDQVTVQAIVDIARGLGKETVAEFVEDAGTLEALRALGVDCAQGYHVGRPQPATVVPVFG